MRNLHSFATRARRRQTVWVVARFAVGLGADKAFREIETSWPDGATQILNIVAADQIHEVVEP